MRMQISVDVDVEREGDEYVARAGRHVGRSGLAIDEALDELRELVNGQLQRERDAAVARLSRPAPRGVEVTPRLIAALPRFPMLTFDDRVRLERELLARREYGIEKYDQSLHTEDGRDDETETLQELLDAAQYAYKAAINGTGLARLRPHVQLLAALILHYDVPMRYEPAAPEPIDRLVDASAGTWEPCAFPELRRGDVFRDRPNTRSPMRVVGDVMFVGGRAGWFVHAEPVPCIPVEG